jgi:ABC-type antimicrobial peptide transport system permease subunit
MWAAIRYRRAQALVLVLLSALVATCAVFAPLYERALEQSLLRSAINEAPVADTALVVRGGRSEADPELSPQSLQGAVPSGLLRIYGQPIAEMTDQIDISPRAGLKPSPGRMVARPDICDHLTLTVGTCPKLAGEVLVSAKDMAAWKWRVGQQFETGIPGLAANQNQFPSKQPTTQTLTVVGAYEVKPDSAYWLRTQLDGKSGIPITVGLEQVPGIDDFVTPVDTFDKRWVQATSRLTYPLRRDLISVGNLDEMADILAARPSGQQANIESQLPETITAVKGGQKQLRVIVPLLMAQLGLLAAAILILVAQAAVEQRRPESALARLRGRSREGAGRLVMGELGLTVALGLPLGVGLAVLLSEIVRRTLLTDGVPFEFPWLAVVGLAAAALVCLLAIVVAVRPLQRQSISALLRRVAPQRRGGLGVVDMLAVALAAFGLIGLATRTLQGPLALLTPTLIALAGGLLASRVAVPVARAVGRTQLGRGKVGPALTAYRLERRPALRKVVTVVSIAVALAVFAANALVVANRNWEARAQLQVGAPLVLDSDSTNPAVLTRTVQTYDPDGARATPVAVIRQTAPDSTSTIAVVGSQFGQVAYEPGGQELRLGSLRLPEVKTVNLQGTTLTGRISWKLSGNKGSGNGPAQVPGLPPGSSPGTPPAAGAGAAPTRVRIAVTTPKGERLTRDLATVPDSGTGSATIDAKLLCPDGCRFDGLLFTPDQFTTMTVGTITISGLALDGQPLGITSPTSWNPFVPTASGTKDSLELTSPQAGTMKFDLQSSGVTVGLSYADVPAVLPGLLAGRIPAGGTAESFPVSGLSGAPIQVRAAQRPGALPVVADRGVMVDLATLERLGGTLSSSGKLSVWVKNPGDRDAVKNALAKGGIGVVDTHTYAAAKERLDTSGSGWGMRLAAFTGVMALLLAALVVVVMTVTGWRTVARDMAALHMAGVGLGTLRRALVREHVTVVVVGVVVGAVCGAVAAVVAMPLLPLFDDPATPVPALQIQPSVAAVVGATAASLVVLVAVAVLCAMAAGRRIALRRVREAL